MTWNSTRAANQRSNSARGIKFTIDQNDFPSRNVEAYLFGTTLPNPYTDAEDNNGDGKSDEAEIVSESNTFPAANTSYYSSVRWSHYFDVQGNWYYDPDGGTIEFVENLSTAGCPFICDKWDTHCCNTPLFLDKNYPSNPQFAASAPAKVGLGAEDAAVVRLPEGRAYGATRANDGAVHLRAQLGEGLSAYSRVTRALAGKTADSGPADGVVTFAYPLSWDEFVAFEALGVTVYDMEFVTSPDADGLRVTYVMTRLGAEPGWVEAEASEAKVDVLGIVSANITVPNRATLRRLEASGYAYLVDLSIADFKRLNPGTSRVLQNDVFWTRVGWQ